MVPSGQMDEKRSRNDKEDIRRCIWRVLEEVGVARPPLPARGRIPNFAGADQAASRLRQLPSFMEWRIVFCNPDSPQRPVRRMLLELGKQVVMATPRLRSGFLVLDPARLPRSRLSWASTIRGAFALGRRVASPPGPVDAKVMGSVAVDPWGGRVGKGGGYSDLEYALLRELNLVKENTPLITTVHDLQLLQGMRLPMTPHDVPVDFIATPTRLLPTRTSHSRPQGISWDLLPPERRAQIAWPPAVQPPSD